MTAPRITALSELAEEAELERRDFVYEATEQLRRFLDANRARLAEIGPIKLVDDEQDYLLFDPVDEAWTTRLTYQDPADSEWYDEEQTVEAVSEVVELYNLADILSWLWKPPPTRQPPHPGRQARPGGGGRDGRGAGEGLAGGPAIHPAGDDRRAAALAARRRVSRPDRHQQIRCCASSPPTRRRCWRGPGRSTCSTTETISWSFAPTAVRDEPRHLGHAERHGRPQRDRADRAEGHRCANHSRVYDPADVLQWVTDALTERFPAVDFCAV